MARIFSIADPDAVLTASVAPGSLRNSRRWGSRGMLVDLRVSRHRPDLRAEPAHLRPRYRSRYYYYRIWPRNPVNWQLPFLRV